MSLSPKLKNEADTLSDVGKPEGTLIRTNENISALSSAGALREAFKTGKVLEAKVTLCDNEHNLHLNLGIMKGIIPREEGALGIDDGTVRDIALISRVNKPVMFRITGFDKDVLGNEYALLSRKSVQADCMKYYIGSLKSGDVIDAGISHMESFGVFADIGAGISALMPIDSISVSRIPHPNVRFSVGERVKAVVRCIDELGRVTLTHKELLGTWEQNAAEFEAGQTVTGIVRSVEK